VLLGPVHAQALFRHLKLLGRIAVGHEREYPDLGRQQAKGEDLW
jgi:hypothetical protein